MKSEHLKYRGRVIFFYHGVYRLKFRRMNHAFRTLQEAKDFIDYAIEVHKRFKVHKESKLKKTNPTLFNEL